MNKKLPRIKKSLKSFILEEDAKVINKSSIKVALVTSFFAIHFLSNIDDVSAKGHHNHNDHNNYVFKNSKLTEGENITNLGINESIGEPSIEDIAKVLNEKGSTEDTQIIEQDELLNLDNKSKTTDFLVKGYGLTNQEIPAKSIATAHGNHYNHSNGGGSS